MNSQMVQTLKDVEEKIIVDVIKGINKKTVADVLNRICTENPNLANVINQVTSIYVIHEKETYMDLVADILAKEGWGRLSIDNFHQIYSFEKPDGYSVRGLAFDRQKIILINLHQLLACAEEYARYISSEEGARKRDYRYFARDSHYDNFTEKFSNKDEAVNFLFWHTLFEQIRSIQQSIQTVDMKEFGYDDEDRAEANDVIGFSKYMYQQYVGAEKAID